MSATYVLPVRVYYEDTDAGGVVYYANYLRFLERARTEWLRSLGYEQGLLAKEHGIVFAVRSIAAEYLRPARLDDMLNVISGIESVGRAQVAFNQRVERKAGMEDNTDELLLTAKLRIACINPARMQPVAMPREIYERLRSLT